MSTVQDNYHPAVARDQINQTHNVEAFGSVPTVAPHRGPIQEDMYPAGIRAIENRGTATQVQELHSMEKGRPVVDNMHPGVARDQINHTHSVEALGSVPVLAPAQETVQKDLYPGAARGDKY
ncbi:hypothetical protein BCR33DRAFT_115486 [Rhizoclosmatium globosum]|uniref:Uncharacterized protein n=1 Tax=Rhizoclosmatium globosum TaxID=329046 RepID=A0A1Y2CJB6_9FUNG|nr:hypothetical protein BCR33DRAFT_115486 [Rhizoclosmatium globosum]|eukprot:ORY47036.1 hypothetical protein BCR33DRAFT_115486 [Rhizoclosmatium globosum]